MPLQEFIEKGIKNKSLPLVGFSCLPSIRIQDQNVLIPVLKNTFMLCYFSYLLTSTCFGYLLHNNFGNRNGVGLSMPRLFTSTLPYLLKSSASMPALGLSIFYAAKTICEKGDIPTWVSWCCVKKVNAAGKVCSWHFGLGTRVLCSFSTW